MISKAQRILACITLLAPVSFSASAQSTGTASSAAQGQAASAFELADVHPTPPTTTPWMTGGKLHGDRYLLHNATMIDMISLAYGVEEDSILGGPPWLDFDRFDISARAPRNTSPDDIKLMLQSLLLDRFKLAVHNGMHPRPSYLLRVDGRVPKLHQADPAEPSSIEEHHAPTANPADGVPLSNFVSGHNRTMTQIAAMLQQSAARYLALPVVDATGLKGGWDYDLTWSLSPSPDGLSIFDAVSRQLGLKLTLEKYPTPVLVVDRVDRTPTPNLPGLDKALPPPPSPEFDVAILKPSKPGAQFDAKIRGNQITATGVTLKFFVAFAYGINDRSTDLIVGAPKFFDQDRWDLLAKASPDALAIDADGKPGVDFDLLPHMVQNMLNERFGMRSHLEDRTINALTLVADHPKMKKADPLNRSGCKEGPGADGKDPRIANPILARLLSCQNMTMTEFAAELPTYAGGYIFSPVLDATGLTDAYDFSLSFSRVGDLHSSLPPPAATGSGTAAVENQSDPDGGLTLKEAMSRQLGVRLEDRKRPVPVLVIDHIDEKPTEN